MFDNTARAGPRADAGAQPKPPKMLAWETKSRATSSSGGSQRSPTKPGSSRRFAIRVRSRPTSPSRLPSTTSNVPRMLSGSSSDSGSGRREDRRRHPDPVLRRVRGGRPRDGSPGRLAAKLEHWRRGREVGESVWDLGRTVRPGTCRGGSSRHLQGGPHQLCRGHSHRRRGASEGWKRAIKSRDDPLTRRGATPPAERRSVPRLDGSGPGGEPTPGRVTRPGPRSRYASSSPSPSRSFGHGP
jgi:hypothetical protein